MWEAWGLGPGTDVTEAAGDPGGLRRAGALLSGRGCVCVLMAVLLRWRGSSFRIVAWKVGMSGPVSSQRERDRGGLMNQRAMEEKSVISLQDLGGDALRCVSVCDV